MPRCQTTCRHCHSSCRTCTFEGNTPKSTAYLQCMILLTSQVLALSAVHRTAHSAEYTMYKLRLNCMCTEAACDPIRTTSGVANQPALSFCMGSLVRVTVISQNCSQASWQQPLTGHFDAVHTALDNLKKAVIIARRHLQCESGAAGWGDGTRGLWLLKWSSRAGTSASDMYSVSAVAYAMLCTDNIVAYGTAPMLYVGWAPCCPTSEFEAAHLLVSYAHPPALDSKVMCAPTSPK